jgi:hypothetical protein
MDTNRTLKIDGYTVETAERFPELNLTVEPAYVLTGPRGAHFDVVRDTRNGNLWAVNLKRSGYLPAALSGNLKAFEQVTA